MSSTYTELLAILEETQRLMSARMTEDRIVLSTLKKGVSDITSLATDQVFASLFRELLLVVDRLTAEEPSQELINSVIEEFLEVFSRYGLEQLERTEKFNPRYQEAIGVIDALTPEEDGNVVEVKREGYRLGSTMLRPARVVVARLPKEER